MFRLSFQPVGFLQDMNLLRFIAFEMAEFSVTKSWEHCWNGLWCCHLAVFCQSEWITLTLYLLYDLVLLWLYLQDKPLTRRPYLSTSFSTADHNNSSLTERWVFLAWLLWQQELVHKTYPVQKYSRHPM